MDKKAKVLQVGHSEAFERYLRYITPHAGDRTYSVLKAHLLFEELLNEYASTQLKNPAALKDARLSFAQTLALAVALHPRFAIDDHHWEALRRLNSLRNKLAHSHVVEDLEVRSVDLAKYIIENGKVPLTDSDQTKDGGVAGEGLSSVPTFALIDVALAGLYASLRVNLEIISKFRTP